MANLKSEEKRKKQKTLWPQHKENEIDEIVKAYGQGTGYAKWQNKVYRTTVKHKDSQ